MSYEVFDRLCKLKNVTAYQVAKETGVSTSTLSSWKKGRYAPKQDKLKKIAEYFGVSLEYMQTGGELSEDHQQTTSYYLNDEAREMAQFLFEHPEHRVLFDASRKLTPEDIQAVVQIINRIKEND